MRRNLRSIEILKRDQCEFNEMNNEVQTFWTLELKKNNFKCLLLLPQLQFNYLGNTTF